MHTISHYIQTSMAGGSNCENRMTKTREEFIVFGIVLAMAVIAVVLLTGEV